MPFYVCDIRAVPGIGVGSGGFTNGSIIYHNSILRL